MSRTKARSKKLGLAFFLTCAENNAVLFLRNSDSARRSLCRLINGRDTLVILILCH